MEGPAILNEHEIKSMCMDSASSSSSSSIQGLSISNQYDLFPLPNGSCGMTGLGTSYFHELPSFAQVGLGNGYYGSPGMMMMQGGLTGGGCELLMPPLEGTSIEENGSSNKTTRNFSDPCHGNNNDVNKINGDHAVGGGIYWEGGNVRMEWDLEDLMKDVTSLPFLDFEVE